MDNKYKVVDETESDFEYVEKDVIQTESEEDSDSREDTLLNIVADVIEMEREIDAEASNIVKFSSDNISDQSLFLQPVEDDFCVKEILDEEIDGDKLEMEIENHAACLEQIMPKTKSEVEMEDSEESESEVEALSEENSLEIQKGIETISIVTDSTDSDFDLFSNDQKRLNHLSNSEETGYPESVQNSDPKFVLSDFDGEVKTEEVLLGQSQNEQAAAGSQSAAESVISAILNDVLSHIENIMLEAEADNDIEFVNYSNYSESASADVTAVCSAAELTAVRPSSARVSEAGPGPEAGCDSVRASSCDDQCQKTQDCEARQSRDNSPARSRDTGCEQSDPDAGLSCNEDSDLDSDFIQEEGVPEDTDILNDKMNEEESEFELYSVEDLDHEVTTEETEENPSIAKLAELKDWLDSKEKEVNDMFDTNDDCSRMDDLDTHKEGNTETILDVQKDFNIQAEILKQLTESILASTEKREPVEKFNQTGEQILNSSSLLISPLTVSGHKSVKKSSGKVKKTSVKSPLLRRKEIRTCINLHNDCENSDVLHEIISPALNFGAASVPVNGDITHADRGPEVSSRVHQINPVRDESHPCQIEDHRKLDVSCQGEGHEMMLDSVVVVDVRIIPLRAKFHAELSAYFDCISFFSPCQANSDAAGCPGSPGRLSLSSS